MFKLLLKCIDMKYMYRGSSQGRSQKKLMTEAMSMEDLWLRQSVLGIESVYSDKSERNYEASASVGLLLATAVVRENVFKTRYVATS